MGLSDLRQITIEVLVSLIVIRTKVSVSQLQDCLRPALSAGSCTAASLSSMRAP